MAHKVKRIIDGKTYNTETATQLGGGDDDYGPYTYGDFLYQNRLGAFFQYTYVDGTGEDDYDRITPLSPDEARMWLEEKVPWKPDLIESLFGEMPEAGSSESKFTLRMPEILRDRLAEKAKQNNQSLNAWIVRCLEAAVADEKPKEA